MKTPEQMEKDIEIATLAGWDKRHLVKEWDYDWECCGNKLMKGTYCPTCRKKQYHRRKMTIYNVELVEIRESDGAQRYEFPYIKGMSKQFKPPCNSIWLTGFNRASDVKLGDKGVLKYESGSCRGMRYGLYFFYKEKNNGRNNHN